MTTEVCL